MRASSVRALVGVALVMAGAALATAPVLALLDAPPAGRGMTAMVALGALLGGLAVGATRPTARLWQIAGAAPAATAALRALMDHLRDRPVTIVPTDLGVIALAIIAGAVGARLGRALPARLGRVFAVGFLQLACQVLTPWWFENHLAGALIAVGLFTMFAGGAAAAWLVPEASVGEIAAGWPALFAVGAGLAFVVAPSAATVLLAGIAFLFAVPVPMALASVGASLVRRGPTTPTPAAVPTATIVR